MDILLHITGLAFIPIVIYILFMGLKDIFSQWPHQFTVRFTTQWQNSAPLKNSHPPHQMYQCTS